MEFAMVFLVDLAGIWVVVVAVVAGAAALQEVI